jgi:hypothetical protein
MAKQLLVDTLNIRLRMEEGAEGGKLVARGQFALADKKTANNRVYRRNLWEREIRRLKSAMEGRKVFGQLDHPDDGRTKLSRVCHLLTSLVVQEDGQVVGAAEILDTTMGKELRAILEGGGSVGVSSRGYGSVKLNELGEDVVQDDFQLDTFDFVVDPAQGTAYPDFTVESSPKPAGAPTNEAEEDPQEAQPDAEEQPQDVVSEPPTNQEPDVAIKSPVASSDAIVKNPAAPAIAALTWDEMPEDIRKEFQARLLVAVAESREALRSEVKADLLRDPKVAGAKAALESLKALLLPFVLEADTAAVVEAKLREIAVLKDRLAKQELFTKQITQENVQLTNAVKDLGYNLYLRKNMGDHPNFEKVVESLGDLCTIPSLEALKNRVKIFETEVAKIRTENQNSAKKLIRQKDDQIKSLSEQIKSLTENSRKIVSERDKAIAKAHESMVTAYLERKLVGNPNASRIRMQFEGSESKSKGVVDSLVESFSSKAPQRQVASERDFDRVRSRMSGSGAGRIPGNLVENALKGTLPRSSSSTLSVGGMDIPLQEFEALSGLGKRS